MIKGISIPIAFRHTGRGNKYKEVDVYFSFTPIKSREIDLLEPGYPSSKNIKVLVNKCTGGNFDFLIPYKIDYVGNYEAPYGMRFQMGLIDGNPTTATLLERIGMIPCKKNNLNTLLHAFSEPEFYIGTEENKLFLYVKYGDDYTEIPSQNYSHRCWQGFAHAAIVLDNSHTPLKYGELDWEKILNEIVSAKE